MSYKSEIIHGINSTHKMKCYQSALRKYTVTCITGITVQLYHTQPHSEQRREEEQVALHV